jgi:hypothetical protein
LLILLFALAAVLTRKCPEYTGVLQKQVQVGKTAMLADAQVCSSSKRTQYAQQECNNESVTPENIESTKNHGDSDGDSTPNLDQIKSLLSSLDPDLLQKLLVEILKE